MPYLLLQGPDGQPVVAQGTTDGKLIVDGGGGGGDATLAEQQVQTGHLSTIAAAADVPTSDVVAAIEALGATATIADVVALLTTDATTQSNILAKLTEIGVDADASATSLLAIQASVADVDANTDQVEAKLDDLRSATGTTADADTSSTLVGLLKWIKARLPTTLGAQGALKVEGVASGTPQPTSTAAGAQVDGHSATLGTTSDASTATTVIGRLQKLVSLLPTALGAGGGLKIDGSGTALPISGTVTATVTGVSTETTLSALNGKFAAAGTHSDGAAQASTTQLRAVLTGINPAAWGGAGTLSAPACDARGLAVQGYVSAGSSVGATVRPLPIFWDGTNQRFGLTDTSGRNVIIGAAANGAAVTGNPVLGGGSDGTNARSFEMKASNPLAADYGLKTREIPLQKSVVKTTAGTPSASLVVRAGPCWLFDVFVSNQSTTNAGYLTVYDLTSAPTNGNPATARKVVGRHLDTKTSGDPFNYKEDFGGMYFATGCVLVIENAEDDANTNTSGAQTMTMDATFVAGT